MDAIGNQTDLGQLLYAASSTQAAGLEPQGPPSNEPARLPSSSFSPVPEVRGEQAGALLAGLQQQQQPVGGGGGSEEAGNGEHESTGNTSEEEAPPGAASCLDETGDEGLSEVRADFLAGVAGSPSAIDVAAAQRLFLRSKQRHVCHVCGRSCPSKHKLKRHLSTHSEERPFNCQLCGKNFKWTEYLAKHMRQQHPGVVTEPALEGERWRCALAWRPPPVALAAISCPACRARWRGRAFDV